jgi:hypothetical protein
MKAQKYQSIFSSNVKAKLLFVYFMEHDLELQAKRNLPIGKIHVASCSSWQDLVLQVEISFVPTSLASKIFFNDIFYHQRWLEKVLKS